MQTLLCHASSNLPQNICVIATGDIKPEKGMKSETGKKETSAAKRVLISPIS
jgi:hypothetical protein